MAYDANAKYYWLVCIFQDILTVASKTITSHFCYFNNTLSINLDNTILLGGKNKKTRIRNKKVEYITEIQNCILSAIFIKGLVGIIFCCNQHNARNAVD